MASSREPVSIVSQFQMNSPRIENKMDLEVASPGMPECIGQNLPADVQQVLLPLFRQLGGSPSTANSACRLVPTVIFRINSSIARHRFFPAKASGRSAATDRRASRKLSRASSLARSI